PQGGEDTGQDDQCAGGEEGGIALEIADHVGIGDAGVTQHQTPHPVLAIEMQHACQAGRITTAPDGITGVTHPAENEPDNGNQMRQQMVRNRHRALPPTLRRIIASTLARLSRPASCRLSASLPFRSRRNGNGPQAQPVLRVPATRSAMIAASSVTSTGSSQPIPCAASGSCLNSSGTNWSKPAAAKPSTTPKISVIAIVGTKMRRGDTHKRSSRLSATSTIANG